MENLVLDMYQSAAIGAVVLALGFYLVKRFSVLRKYCIPAAVIGGLAVSFVMLLLHSGGIAEVSFDRTVRDLSMTAFFCSVGFMASVSAIKSGKRVFLIMLVVLLMLTIMQNAIGVFSATSFGLDPKYGLALGSISLLGGHGTAAAYGDVLVNDYGLVGADVVAIASATFGLVISGLIGGPLGRKLVVKNELGSGSQNTLLENSIQHSMSNDEFLKAVLILLVCMGAGTLIVSAFDVCDITVPGYLGGLLISVIVRNVCDYKKIQLPDKEIEMIGWAAVCLFLAMALMSMKLWELANLASVMVLTLVIQAVVLGLITYFLVFRITGRNYESAVLSAGLMGFGMGATPNAVANMEAVIEEHGPAPGAYLLVPILGGVFLDLINAGVLTVMLNTL